MQPLLHHLRLGAATRITLAGRKNSVLMKRAPQISQRQRKAPYYFEASQHSSLSLRLMLEQLREKKTPADIRKTHEFLCRSMDSLLQSIRPGMDDDAQSQQYFFSLLRMHLSHLSSDELTQLSVALKTSHFSCHIAETIIDDEVYRDHGFSNGPPHSFNRTLMQTQDFFNVLEDLKECIQLPLDSALRTALVCAARDALPACAQHWQSSEKTPEDLYACLCQLGQALDLPVALTGIITGQVRTKASTISIAQGVGVIDQATAEAMMKETHGTLFADVLRDLLELLLTQKLFGVAVSPDVLTHCQRRSLSAAINKVYTQPLTTKDPAWRIMANTVLKESHGFGQIQIQPTTGVALGHAWIAPMLSLVPDMRKISVDLGRRYMHSGFQLEPGDARIREWPTHFMSAKENDETYPADHAWHVRVPVEARRLQQAALDVRHDWQSLGLPYRFIGTEPGMPATGCRVTVWEAVKRGMSADARSLFDHFNCGLPDPQSPTELWQRLDGLMRWMETLATG